MNHENHKITREDIKEGIKNDFDSIKNLAPRPICSCCKLPLGDEAFLEFSLNKVDKMTDIEFENLIVNSTKEYDNKTKK